MVGLIERAEHITSQWFKEEGDSILLLGVMTAESDPLLGLGGSAYLQSVHGLKTGKPPRCDLEVEKQLHEGLLALIREDLVKSAHDCSDGGFAVALAECCIAQQLARETPRLMGVSVDLSSLPTRRLDALLFGETQSRVLISVAARNTEVVLERAKALKIPAAFLGTVGGAFLKVQALGRELRWDLSELHDLWWNAIARAMRE
jgi:phosphoribosylformylglycinamidine synthase